ncbi:hypothetical protein SDC9_150911 [bioreactor metagenome]|uniref:Uncharacterized protein n=1 Tax=bioreactor metagenome TaxID=1076179 RepID=A0A645ERA5_9ZZZZ
MQVFHIAATAYHRVDQLLYLLFGHHAFKVQQRDAVVAAQHVDDADLFVHQLVCPRGKPCAVGIFQRVQHQPRQKEVVGHVAFLGKRLVSFFSIAGVDLRQQRQLVFVRQLLHPGK